MTDTILKTFPLVSMQWPTIDPFLFCVHHVDNYPAGDRDMAPVSGVSGRQIGMDFSGKDGWSMYHGEAVPGFPAHPHRGFETVTIARSGYIDHSDSLGAHARFGNGDVQWMTAGKGVVHSEMFPLIHDDARNPTELFQIWLNLPRDKKLVEPHFTMFWSEDIPKHTVEDPNGNKAQITVIAGQFGDAMGRTPPPDSWASDERAHLAIWTIKMDPDVSFVLPAGPTDTVRTLYFFAGEKVTVAGQDFTEKTGIVVEPDQEVEITNGPTFGEILVLQGRPIGEPVAQQGPFVMNYPGEIRQAMVEYQETRFGGWPWKSDGPVHPRTRGRFAVHADGREEHR